MMISHTHLTHHTYHMIAGECGEEKREGEGEGEGGGGKSRAEQSRAGWQSQRLGRQAETRPTCGVRGQI